ncbi:hypothetical protein G1H11_04920 [Phytoactinopolyspora alkaliphila]|uniref:Uncharacterized protein n=1 Tax=Phytoactinopolyspora alkaliphila TaxID=1783498 RepID=A0A6N9YIB9_9ACTN|nr:hypothetical protein [Phytoactinopolyspora alkaliphila]NED94648.1 hypothetical protein [Phytoactinopolyspora alkaliphila]
MTVAAVAFLGATAVVAAVLWYLVDRRKDRISTTAAVLAAAVPAVLLGVAALLAVLGPAADDGTLRTAHVVAVVAAVPGGALVARAVLRLADRRPGGGLAGDEKPSSGGGLATTDSSPAVPLPPPPPPPPPAAASSSPPAWTPRVPWDAPRGPSASAGATAGWRNARAVSDPETLRGGATIGSLERVAIVVSLLAGWPEGLALTLAVKGFGRYPELRKPSAPERFIIGTFASILWAAAVAGTVVALRP